MMRKVVLGAVLALGPSISWAYVEAEPGASLVERLPRARASFTCMQLLTDGIRARAAEAEIKKANRIAAKAKRAAAKAEKIAAEANAKARQEAPAAGLPPPEVILPAPVAPAPVDPTVDRFHEGKVTVNLDPSGAPIRAYKMVRELAVPMNQLDRIARPTQDTFAKRIVRRFKQLVDRNFLVAPSETRVLVDDFKAKDFTPAMRLAVERVSRRLAEHSGEVTAANARPYLVRHVLKGRVKIVEQLYSLARKARLNEQILMSHLDEQAEVRKAKARAANPMVDEVEPEYYPPLGIEIPGFTTENAAKTWKALGWGAVAAAGFVALFTPDPKIMLPLFLAATGGLSFYSASVRNEVSNLVAHVRAIFQKRRDKKELAIAADLLAERHQRNLIQIETLELMAQRLENFDKKEYGFAYYSYMAEVPSNQRTDGVIDITTDPFADPRLVRVEHVIYTDESYHYMLTFVTDANGATVEMTNLALAPGA